MSFPICVLALTGLLAFANIDNDSNNYLVVATYENTLG